MLSGFIAVCSAVLVWYTLSFKRAVDHSGLDPTLLTYISLLNPKRPWLNHSLSIVGVIGLLVYKPLMIYAALIMIIFNVVHVVLLLSFDRVATQPVSYYLLTIIVGISLLFCLPVAAIPLVLTIVSIQKLCIVRWNKTQASKYDHWVYRKSLRIYQRYHDLDVTMTTREWFYLLHVAVTEDIARPTLVRAAERIYFYIKRPSYISTGIMQVRNTKPLSDRQSMVDGATIIRQVVSHMPEHLNLTDTLTLLAQQYNGSTTYSRYLLATQTGFTMAWANIERKLQSDRPTEPI